MDVLAKAETRPSQKPLWAVAYSGGADSTALLIQTHRQHPRHTIAFHVHHGLQAAADDFVRHCEQFCAHLQVPLYVTYVNAKPRKGESPEDAARTARYKALSDMAHAYGVASSQGAVLLAQHADDQIETLLLALSRGAGLAGLSAMPAHFERSGVSFERPLLHQSAADIRAMLKAQHIAFIEDPSNLNTAYLRNQIRHDLLPTLKTVLPHYQTTFARSIAHIAAANDLLASLAAIDLAVVGAPPKIKDLQTLDPHRQANAIRFWLKTQHSMTPSLAQLNELLKQIAACQTRGHRIHLKVAQGFVDREGDVLRYNLPLSF